MMGELSNKTMVVITAICFAIAGLSSTEQLSAEETTTLQLPIEAFANLPGFSGAKFSRSGSHIAYFITHKGRRHIVYHGVDGLEPGVLPPSGDADIDSFFWASDNVIILKYGFTANRLAFRGKSYETRTISFNIETQKSKWLGKPRRISTKGAQRTSQHERIVDRLPDDPNHILMQLDFELDGTPAVYRVNIETGSRKTVQNGRRGIQHWYTDQNSEIRMGIGYHFSKRYARLKTTEGDWIDLTDTDWWERYDVEGFTEDPNVIFVSGQSSYGTDGIFKLDLTTGKLVERVFAHENVDAARVVYHPVTGQFAGVGYVDDVYRIKYTDKHLDRLQRSFEKAMPGKDIFIAGRAYDKELYLVHVDAADDPGDYYVYDRPKRNMAYIASARMAITTAREQHPGIIPAAKPVSIPVRDGSEIPAYLTLPPSGPSGALATIILPHGGPSARDSAAWDYWAQFYVNRGYAVLQPNFRGSTGYGRAFRNAGKKQWGGLMQDDVTDATRWMIEEGIADPEKICIVGASYGGYAALMGPIKEPGLYRCAISVNGVTDLPRLKASDKNYIGGRVWIKDMGLAGVEDKDVSPYDRADELTLPVMVIASKDDERVPYSMSRALYSRLKKRRDDAEYVEIESGGHSMVTSESRLIMLRETEQFLAAHLSPPE